LGTTAKVGKTINGSRASETLTGTAYADIIFGGGGDDTIFGGGGADRLRGGAGADTLTGGTGNDVFVFESTLAQNGVDTITDLGFKRGGVLIGSNDVLDLSLAITSSKISSQNIGNYVKIIDNKLYVDLDGTGAGEAQVWANLSGLQAGDKVNVRTTSFDGWITVSAPADTSAPTFEGTTSFTYDENQSAGATIATITGFSDNVGVTEYRFCDSGGASGGSNSSDWWFSIGSGGVITMTGSGAASDGNDYEAGASQSHTYYIQARDAAGNWSAPVLITLGEDDVAEDTTAPTFEGTSSFTYDENQSGGATIATIDGFTDDVAVTDYRFSDSSGGSGASDSSDGFFSISSGGVITMTGSGATSDVNDYETGVSQSHTYYVQARDAAGNWSTVQAITLGELDLDDTAPTFFEGTTSFTYDENQSSGATIATLNGFTDDVGVTGYRFSDASGGSGAADTSDGYFTISSGGVITMTGSGAASAVNDYETGASQSHTYYVQARDAAGNWSAAQAITLGENDVTEDTTAPSFEGTSSFTYDENQSGGATIATISGFTDDVGVTGYRFSDSGGSGGSADSGDGFFSISSGGVITMTGSGAASAVNDYETGVSQSHTYYVQARDAAGNWSAAQTITLGEVDVAEATGTFISVSGHFSASGGPVWLDTDEDGVFDVGETALYVDASGGIHTGSSAGTLVDFTSGDWTVEFWDVLGPTVNLNGFGAGDEAIINMAAHSSYLGEGSAEFMGHITLCDTGLFATTNTANRGVIHTEIFLKTAWLSASKITNDLIYRYGRYYSASPSTIGTGAFAINFGNLATLSFVMPNYG
jgi:hypothetical protein